jgi:hypothetical protein
MYAAAFLLDMPTVVLELQVIRARLQVGFRFEALHLISLELSSAIIIVLVCNFSATTW